VPEEIEKAKKEVIEEIARKVLWRSLKDLDFKILKKMTSIEREIMLVDVDRFVQSDWFITLCLISKINQDKMKEKFEEELDDRFKYYNFSRSVNQRPDNTWTGWERLASLCSNQ